MDPSSKVSGGALLGDRGRIQAPSQAPVYVRSFAARDRLGGLSREAFSAVFLLRHLCDVVLVETVGVGQSETDVAHVADTVVLVVQPFSGDLLQFIKAGVMEIPDVLAVNKADDEALARKAVAEVKAALAFERRPWSRPVLAVSATTDLHLEALEKAIAAYEEALHFCSLDNLPEKYAMLQLNLGNAYIKRIEGVRRVISHVVAYVSQDKQENPHIRGAAGAGRHRFAQRRL